MVGGAFDAAIPAAGAAASGLMNRLTGSASPGVATLARTARARFGIPIRAGRIRDALDGAQRALDRAIACREQSRLPGRRPVLIRGTIVRRHSVHAARQSRRGKHLLRSTSRTGRQGSPMASGIVTNGMLCVTGPELTADEWTARP